ncbi:MAG: excinuclease ABC subunit UvrA [Candidatus Aureabacteria bacterium]|nr:excinuclease ABC subunit UvrA [Candidatus Auribacterota bacterium]
MEPSFISIKGAREHNLKNVSLEIPKKKLVVFTGVSGSGKSSLAFDILYAEGQRRYVESLSAYARQFLEQMPKPHFEYIKGLSPAISIEQKSTSKNPRSTVGTVTEIFDYLRVLYSRIGKQHCVQCKKTVSRQSSSDIVRQIKNQMKGTILISAPVAQNRKGEFREIFEGFKTDGFSRMKVDGHDILLSDPFPVLNKKQKHNIELVIDRIPLQTVTNSRLTESVELALKYGRDFLSVESDTDHVKTVFSTKFACVECGISYHEYSPQHFSFNSPLGMCEDCHGLGYTIEVDPNLIIPDPDLSISGGALQVWNDRILQGEGWDGAVISSLISSFHIDKDTAWKNLPKEHQNVILYGTGKNKIHVKFVSREERNEWSYSAAFQGVVNKIRKNYHETKSEAARLWYAQFMREMQCVRCRGNRLKETSTHVYVSGKSIVDLCQMTVSELEQFLHRIQLQGNDKLIADELIKEVNNRVRFLMNVGLEYLTLDRRTGTLSGGESQRIRLASQIGSELSGVMYILDEPSIGLHQRDNTRLLNSLKHLRDIGNSVIVIEHDEETIRNADHIVDFGPGAGMNGGKIVASGPVKSIISNKKSLTGTYLSRINTIPVPKKRRVGSGKVITIFGARENNLNIHKLNIPLNQLVCITGVSGAGKSSLINQILIPAVTRALNKSIIPVGVHEKIEGLEQIDKIINIDQKPIGRSSRSNPATYTKVYDLIRELFANLPESKVRGYHPGRFSFNVKGGRCETCQGEGFILVEMHFLPDIHVECEICKGRRFNDSTLEILYKGKSISDVLNMSIVEACQIFDAYPKIKTILKTLMDVGMDYIPLGQSSTTLSGGEAQRIKLSRELCKIQTGKTMYVLDEPTTGLHFDDIKKLLNVLNRLVDQKNTVIVIEHNLDVIKVADHIIDLGPEGGDQGGKIVAEGPPEKIIKHPASYTGKYLKKALQIGHSCPK